MNLRARLRSRFLGASVAAGAAVSLTLLVAAPAVAAVPPVTLPLEGVTRIVVDAAHSHIFITGAPADSVIAVQDLDGYPAAKLTGESGAGGMVLVGNTLYVARCGSGMIDVFDTSTLTKTGSITADPGGIGAASTCDLAYAGGQLWYINAANTDFGHLESVSLDASHTIIDTHHSFTEGAIFATSPAHPNWLIVVDGGQEPSSATVFDVTDPSAVTQLSSIPDVGGTFAQSVAVTPDGSQLLVATGVNGVSAFSLPSFTAATGYTLSEPGVQPPYYLMYATAVSPSGNEVAAGGKTQLDIGPTGNAFLWDSGAGSPFLTWPGAGQFTSPIDPGGLAFLDDSTLYAVNGQMLLPGYTKLNVISTLPDGTVSITAAAPSVKYAQTDQLTAHLGTASADQSLSIYATPAGGSVPRLEFTGTVDASGNVTFDANPGVDTSYVAVWPGDDGHAATASSPVSVTVSPLVAEKMVGGYRTTAKHYRLYHYTTACPGSRHRGCPTFACEFTPSQAGQSVTVQLEEYVSGRWRSALQTTVRVKTRTFEIRFIYRSTRIENIPTRVRAVYGGDSLFGPVTGKWVHFKVTS